MTAVQFLSKCYPCNYLLDSTGGSIYDVASQKDPPLFKQEILRPCGPQNDVASQKDPPLFKQGILRPCGPQNDGTIQIVKSLEL